MWTPQTISPSGNVNKNITKAESQGGKGELSSGVPDPGLPGEKSAPSLPLRIFEGWGRMLGFSFEEGSRPGETRTIGLLNQTKPNPTKPNQTNWRT